MPKFVRYFVKTGMAFFVASLFVALMIMAQPVFQLPSWVVSLSPVYFHLFMVGWVTQLIFGVSIWMFPSHPGENRFGNETVIWWIYGTLNTGLLIRAVAEPIVMAGGSAPNAGPMLVISSFLQWIAAILYLYIMWPRVEGKG